MIRTVVFWHIEIVDVVLQLSAKERHTINISDDTNYLCQIIEINVPLNLMDSTQMAYNLVVFLTNRLYG